MALVICRIEKKQYLCTIFQGSYQSGQMGLTVTQLSFDFGGSNPSLPTTKKVELFLLQK